MGANGKSRRWLSRSNWQTPGDMTHGQTRRLDKAIAKRLAEEQLASEEPDEETNN